MAREFAGVAVGIILCAWWVGATSDQVALMRLPAALYLCVYSAVRVVVGIKKMFA